MKRTEYGQSGRELAERLPALLLLSGCLILIVWLGFKTWRVARLAQSLQGHQARAEALTAEGLLSVDPDEAEALVMELRQDVKALDRELRPFLPLTTRLGWLPRVGPLMQHSAALMDMADAGTEAAAYATRGLKPVLHLLQAENRPGDELVPRLLPILQGAEGDLRSASQALDRAVSARRQIDNLDGFPWRVRSILEMIDGKLYLADELKLLTVLPSMLGVDGPRTYLILAQNEDEIRPTGGFLTGAGLLTFDRGQIASLSFQDGNLVDDWRNKPYEFPPEPLYTLMGLELFLFRDANFWPDFPTSARQAMQLYTYGQDEAPALDGAIAIDQRFVAMLLAVTGPIEVAELETTVASNSVIDDMRAAWGANDEDSLAEWALQRKDFLGPLAQAMRTRLLSNFTDLDPLFLAETMYRAAQEKHVQIYVKDPEVAAILDEINWNGEMELPAEGDHLMVVETNVGYNKVNALIESSIIYDVELLPDGTGLAKLTLHYVHTAEENATPCQQIVPYDEGITYESLMEGCFWNYLRIYVPDGITPVEVAEHPLQAGQVPATSGWQEQVETAVQNGEDSTVIATTFVLPHGQTLISEYVYNLPAVVLVDGDGGNHYILQVKKQAGVGPREITVRVTVPPGATVETTAPSASVEGREVSFNAQLATDLSFEVSFR